MSYGWLSAAKRKETLREVHVGEYREKGTTEGNRNP